MQTELTFAQRMSQVVRSTKAAQRLPSCRVARNLDEVIRRARLGEEPNTYPHDLPVLNSKGN
jgi:hypothetical protein